MKVFISGPMSGKPNGNKEVFFKAEYKLKGLGYSVFNPAWFRYGYNTEFSEYDMRSIDFTALDHCDAIYMLKGWQYSKGAKAEYEYAKMHGKQILRENDPITDPMLHDRAHCLGKEPVFDQEFSYDEAVKNRTNYQLEVIKENIKEKYVEFKTVTRDLDIGLGNESDRINSLEGEVEAIKESIGTDNLQEQLEKDFADVYEEFQNTKDKVNDIEFGYIDWSSKMSSAIEEMEKVKKTVTGLNSLVATLGERNKALENKTKDFDGSCFNLVNSVLDIRRIIYNSDIENISIKAMNQKLIDLGKELDVYIDDYKEAYKHLNNADDALERRIEAIEKRHKTANNTLFDFNTRIKAIEKRLSIKPFYEPTEDEKEDD